MTTDKIIAAACEAAGHPPETELPMQPNREMLAWLERFYAIAYRQGLEDAVSACDETMAPINIGSIQLANAFHDGTHACIDAIRALKEQPNG